MNYKIDNILYIIKFKTYIYILVIQIPSNMTQANVTNPVSVQAPSNSLNNQSINLNSNGLGNFLMVN